ncbi:transcriptional regulator with XRE-family HTH domain [Nocardia transvalensis]|uniref:Transcriptional regulator with XRE-family HTH domain n=1 Tax=Nocardia transvalensis TaxID=37333 RepID=A0A7W9UG26_9NOCA|nr:helix-turn-helix domain-containing protein [Nocardia transvalensis]MBB5911717.1 transcriptional regulator with XRE-family HTH domain [Nocardia transvalensis]
MIVSTWTGVEVRALRTTALRLTQEQFAERLGYQPPTVRKWEKATHARPVRGESAQALDTELARLDAEQRARFRTAMDEQADRQLVTERSDSLAVSTRDIDQEVEDEVKRREFGILLGAAFIAAGGDSSLALNRIGIDDARRLSESVTDFAQREQAIGGVTLVMTAVEELERAKALLETCTFTDPAGRAFMSAAGELATIAGWLAYDADLHPLARRCYADAFALANQAGDNDLTVHVCLNAAHQSIALSRTGEGNPHRALGHLNRARDLTIGRRPGRIHALIATREALSHALLGDRSGFGRSIATAWRELDFALDHEPLNDCPRWLRFVNPTEVRSHEAKGFGDLGDSRKSADLLAAGAELEQAGTRNAANYRAAWAATLADIGDTDGAVTQGLSVLDDLENSVSSTRTLRLLAPVRSTVDTKPDNEFRIRFDNLKRKVTSGV